MNVVDVFLDRYTAYRFTLIGLGIVAGVAFIESLLHWLVYPPIELILSLVILLFATKTTSALCTLYIKSAPAPESAYITALILFLVLSPLQSSSDAIVFFIAGAVAVLSKYVLAWKKVHVFNPTAVALFAVSVAGTGLVSWWVATPVLFPFVLVVGLLVAQRARRTGTFLTFAFMVLLIFGIRSELSGTFSGSALSQFVLTTPLLFFGAFMLIDPQTSPLERGNRSWYAVLVGILSFFSFTLGPVTSSPELALLVGNVLAYITGKRKRFALSLQDVTQLSKEVYEFRFLPNKEPQFLPGQYMEWTLPHKSADSRGVRRYFAMTSSPSEHFVRFVTTIPVECSSFKEALFSMRNVSKKHREKKENVIFATNVTGDFVLPKDPAQKICMIAGGIGIAPYMSMFRHLASKHERRDIVLIYSVKAPNDFIFQKEIDSFKDAIGLSVLYLPIDFTELSQWEGPTGNITHAYVTKLVRDFTKRAWFISGNAEKVDEYQQLAESLGLSKGDLKVFHT